MNIALVTTTATPGGVHRHLADLGAALHDRGHSVTIIAPEPADHLARQATNTGLHVQRSATPSSLRRFDVMHLHLADTFDRRAVRLLLGSRAAHPSTLRVVTEHLPHNNASDPQLEPGPRRPGAYTAKTWLKRTQLWATDRTIAVSTSSATFLTDRYGADPGRVAVVENGIDPQLNEDPTPGPRSGVITIGTLARQKGHDILIDAAARSQRSWHVTVVGEGAGRAGLEEQARRTAPGRVSFLGRRNDATDLLDSSAVFCLPSRWEAAPYVVLEAMRAAVPVVATRVDGVVELVEDERSGFLVDPDDPVGLAEVLDHLDARPELARRMGKSGRVRQRTRFTVHGMAESTEAVYLDGLADRR
jgi:glycosyltransferase involved in cell wall biosynthesis